MTDILENLRKEFKIMVSEYTWMDEPSKKTVLDKVDFCFVSVFFFSIKMILILFVFIEKYFLNRWTQSL